MADSMKEIIAQHEGADSFKYQMLDRLRSDCNYYLGYGGRHEKCLWSGNVADHIEDMMALWNSFPAGEKPEWLTMAQIEEYAKAMKGE